MATEERNIMKTKQIVVCMVLAGGCSVGVFNAVALHEVSASVEIRAEADFYAPLEAQGVWVEVGSYGRCWHPARIEAGWRPYAVGHWVWTEDCGWYWVSDEPWAWACYHYGRWVYDPHFAWVWVPGVEWGPAWVAWRVGGGYVGWAPLPPRVEFGRGEVILASSVTVAPEHFVFVEANRFHERITPASVIVNNKTVINKTTLLTNIKRADRTFAGAAPQRVVVNEGPGLSAMQKATNQKISKAEVHDMVRQTPAPEIVTRRGQSGQAPNAAQTATRPEKERNPGGRDIAPPRGKSADDDDSSDRGKGHGDGGEKGKGRGSKKH
jgi:hypothetical protein